METTTEYYELSIQSLWYLSCASSILKFGRGRGERGRGKNLSCMDVWVSPLLETKLLIWGEEEREKNLLCVDSCVSPGNKTAHKQNIFFWLLDTPVISVILSLYWLGCHGNICGWVGFTRLGSGWCNKNEIKKHLCNYHLELCFCGLLIVVKSSNTYITCSFRSLELYFGG